MARISKLICNKKDPQYIIQHNTVEKILLVLLKWEMIFGILNCLFFYIAQLLSLFPALQGDSDKLSYTYASYKETINQCTKPTQKLINWIKSNNFCKVKGAITLRGSISQY